MLRYRPAWSALAKPLNSLGKAGGGCGPPFCDAMAAMGQRPGWLPVRAVPRIATGPAGGYGRYDDGS